MKDKNGKQIASGDMVVITMKAMDVSRLDGLLLVQAQVGPTEQCLAEMLIQPNRVEVS